MITETGTDTELELGVAFGSMYLGKGKAAVPGADFIDACLEGRWSTYSSVVLHSSPSEELHNWDVKAQCAALYHGAAKVTECDDNGLPYGSLSKDGAGVTRDVGLKPPESRNRVKAFQAASLTHASIPPKPRDTI